MAVGVLIGAVVGLGWLLGRYGTGLSWPLRVGLLKLALLFGLLASDTVRQRLALPTAFVLLARPALAESAHELVLLTKSRHVRGQNVELALRHLRTQFLESPGEFSAKRLKACTTRPVESSLWHVADKRKHRAHGRHDGSGITIIHRSSRSTSIIRGRCR